VLRFRSGYNANRIITGFVGVFSSVPPVGAFRRQGQAEEIYRHTQTISCLKVDGKLIVFGSMDGSVFLVQKGYFAVENR